MDIDKQYEILTWGVDEILTKNDFKNKLEISTKENRPLKIKLGVDPTAPDIHLGHTVVLRKLRAFQDLGHTAVLLIGGFTSQIGDPSGKSKTRPPLSLEDIEKNAKTYLTQVKKVLLPQKLEVVNNTAWLDNVSLKDMIKLLSHATMSKLLEHNTFKERFNGSGSIRMHEFIYPFLQAYDSIHLKADIELGGTDQLFNIAFGRELQKEFGQTAQSALLMPILTGTDGIQKMSKSLNNYIGVTESPRTMSQKILNMPDSNITSYFKLLTPLSPEKVLDIEKIMNSNPDTDTILEYKNLLIDEILKIYHPKGSKTDTDVLEISKDNLIDGSIPILKALSLTGFAKSNREANQFIQGGAVRIDSLVIKDRNFQIDLKESPVQLTVGKKKIITLKLK